MRVESLINEINNFDRTSLDNKGEVKRKKNEFEKYVDNIAEEVINASDVKKTIFDETEAISKTKADELLKSIKESICSDEENLKVLDGLSEIRNKVVSSLTE